MTCVTTEMKFKEFKLKTSSDDMHSSLIEAIFCPPKCPLMFSIPVLLSYLTSKWESPASINMSSHGMGNGGD